MKPIKVSATAVDVRGQLRQQPSAYQLSALASFHLDVETKKHARLVLRHNGFSGSDAMVEALVQRIHSIKRERVNRVQARILNRLGHIPSTTKHQCVARPAHALLGKPKDRLEQLRKSAVLAAAQKCLRHGAAGGTSFRVSLTRDPGSVGYEVVMSSNRDTYRGRFKGWSAGEDHHHIQVPTDWRVRVQRRGLATCGGMLTLDLQPLMRSGDIELFQAVWVAQARGYGVTVHRGVIARLDSEVFHGADAKSAIRGVLLKVRRAAATASAHVSLHELTVDAFVARYARYDSIDVCVGDARAIGACEYGIQAWCNAVGIDVAQGSISLRRVLEAFRLQPMIEVRRTVLQAIKGHRADVKMGRPEYAAYPAHSAEHPAPAAIVAVGQKRD